MSIARHLAFIVARFVAIDIADWSLEILLDYAVDPPASHGAALRLPYLPHSLDGSLMSIVWAGHGHSQQPRPLSCNLTIHCRPSLAAQSLTNGFKMSDVAAVLCGMSLDGDAMRNAWPACLPEQLVWLLLVTFTSNSMHSVDLFLQVAILQ